MSMQKSVVKNRFGEFYKLQLPREYNAQLTLKAETFWNEESTQQFINNLTVSNGYWREIVKDYSTIPSSSSLTNNEIEQKVADLMIQGQLKFYPVDIPDIVEHPPEKRVLKSSDDILYRFTSISSLLLNDASETKKFKNADEASDFISQLNPSNEQITTISHELNINIPISAELNPSETIDIIAKELISGNIVIIVDKTSTVPESKKEIENKSDVGNRDAKLGTRTEDKKEKEEKPPCQLDWVSVKCKHGRDTGITKKSVNTPTLAVISTETKVDGFDSITAEIHSTELCTSHKDKTFKINKQHKFSSRTDNKIEFDVSCDRWNLSNVFERIWLPSIKPKTYNIETKKTCKTADITVKDVNVDVYPEIEWFWDTHIDFGKLEFEPGKSKVKYSDFKIDGDVTLTYDGEPHNAKEKYKKYIQDPLDGFKKICDTISKVLEKINSSKSSRMRIGTQALNPEPENGEDNKDGNETRLIIEWPKLDIYYKSSLIENKSPSLVDHKYKLKVTAKSLLEIDIQVDVLDSIISLAPAPAKALIRYAKKRAKEEIKDSQKTGVRGEFDIIFTIKSTIDINESEISGQHNITNHDVEVSPVKGDIHIPTKLEGVIKAEGKWFYLSFKVHYEMTGEAEWAGQYEFGNDEKGVYFSNAFEFKGIDITLTEYGEVKAKVKVDPDDTDDMYDTDASVSIKDENIDAEIDLKDGQINGEAALKAKNKKQWTWLKPRKDKKKKKPKKYYIVKR